MKKNLEKFGKLWSKKPGKVGEKSFNAKGGSNPENAVDCHIPEKGFAQKEKEFRKIKL